MEKQNDLNELIRRLELLESAVNNLTRNLITEPLESSQEEVKPTEKELINSVLERYEDERII